jgi:anti-sigma regulatory factor (Ser/Thr protein kinase)
VNEWSVTLRLPADAGWLSIVRLFVASSGKQLELDAETVEDVKLVVTELCSAALENTTQTQGTLTVEIRSTDGAAAVTVRGTGLTFGAISHGDVRGQMLEALVPELRLIDERQGAEFPVPAHPAR